MASSRTIGGYRLIGGLGQGGMARVYLAIAQKQSGFTKLMVLKVLRSDLTGDSDFIQMFLAEARIAARFNHPHVVQTYEIGEDAGRHFLAMEYLEGQPLSSILKSIPRSQMPLEVHVRILSDMLEGLQYAHELADFDGTPLRLVHRDVSPQNVFVTYAGPSKLLDFGIAKVGGSATRTQQGLIKGKAGYMAPEQARGETVDRRSDLFAVGVMLWEALAGRRLVLPGEDDIVVLTRRATGGDPPIREVNPEAPEALALVCDKAMAADPEDRFATAAEMNDALGAWLRPRHTYARDVASLLEQHFAKNREELRSLVEEQVAATSPTGPMIDFVSRGTVTPPSSDDLLANIAADTAPPPARRRRAHAAYVAAGAATLAVLTGAAVMTRAGHGRNAASSPPPAAVEAIGPSTVPSAATVAVATPAEAAVAPPSPAASVSLRFDVHPSGAKVVLDGRALVNPGAVSVPRGDGAHLVRVSASGYAPEERAITFQHDQDVVVTLSHGPRSPARAGTPVRVDDDVVPGSSQRTPRAVDDQDPYK